MNTEQEMYFDQCVDFLARMIEKYGDHVKLPSSSIQESSCNSNLAVSNETTV